MKSLTMRVFISIFAVVLFSMLSPGPSEAAEPIKLVLGSTGVPDVTTWWACEDFVERVARYSNGEIIVEHHGAGALGSDKKLAQSVKLGTIDMGSVSNANYSSVGNSLQPFDLPYITHGTMNLYRVINNSKVRSTLEKKVEQDGYKYIMMFPIGPTRQAFNSKREVRVPADAKGIRIRVTASPINHALVKSWGFLPVPIAWGETYTSIKQGIVNGVYTPEMWVFGVKISEVCKFETVTGGNTIWHIIPMNLKKWKSLSPKHQAVIDRAARESELAAFIYDKYLETRGRRNLINAGVKIYTPTLEEMKLWMEPAKKVFDDAVEKLNMDKDFIKLIQDAQIPVEEY